MCAIKLEDVKKTYKQMIKQDERNENFLTVDNLLDFSVKKSAEIQVKNILPIEEDGDMLLFQYGKSFDKKYFFIDVTRQFITAEEDIDEQQMYQLSFMYFFDVKNFERVENGNCWNTDFNTVEEWVNHIKTLDCYHIAKNLKAEKYELDFDHI